MMLRLCSTATPWIDVELHEQRGNRFGTVELKRSPLSVIVTVTRLDWKASNRRKAVRSQYCSVSQVKAAGLDPP